MSLWADGRYHCDRCGRELENGGVHECAIISDLEVTEDGQTIPVQRHLCRESCVNRVLTAKALAALRAQED